MKKKIPVFGILYLLTGCLLSFSPVDAQQGPAVGYVAAVRGHVMAINSENESRTLAIKSDIYEEDTIKTGEQGRIQIVFLDNSIISLGRNTEMCLSQYQWRPEDEDGAMKTKVKEGIFRVMGGAITKVAPEKFSTETPSATIGIRGSMYAGRVKEDSLMVVFQGGRGIFITNPAGSVSISTPGFATYVKGLSLAPVKPYKLTTSELKDLHQELRGPDIHEKETEPEPKPRLESETGNRPGFVRQHDPEPGTTADGGPGFDPEGGSGHKPEAKPLQEPHEGPLFGQKIEPGPLPDYESKPRLGEEPGFLEDMPPKWESLTEFIDLEPRDPLPIHDLFDPFVGELGLWKPPQMDDPLEEDKLSDLGVILDMISGKFLAVLKNTDDSSNVVDRWWQGDIARPDKPVLSIDGSINTEIFIGDGTAFFLNFSIPPFEERIPFTGTRIGSGTLDVTFSLGLERTLSLYTQFSDRGEFVAFGADAQFPNISRDLGFFGFAGIPAESVPHEGVEEYMGRAAGYLQEAQRLYGFSGTLEMEVNWRNGKVIGMLSKDDQDLSDPNQLYFFGNLSDTGLDLTDIRFLGPSKGALGMPSAWEGNATFESFFGGEHQGFGAVANGNTYDIMSNQLSPQGDWGVTMAGFRDVTEPFEDPVSPSGASDFNGFILGVSENMNAPDVRRRIYMNQSPDDFHFTVNRDTGTLAGYVRSATDIRDPGNEINHLTIGADYPSAYVLDDRFIAILGCSSSDCIRNSNTYQTGLKPTGNYLITARPDEQFTEGCYAKWGYWEISFEDPDPTLGLEDRQYHAHIPGSLWVAGPKTPEIYVQGLMDTDFVGTYVGGARGVRIDPNSVMTELRNGRTDLTLDFSRSAREAVSGTIAFDQRTLRVDSLGASINTGGFSALIDGATGNGINGAFYGPNAESIGGNFSAGFSGDRYLGVFGADRLP